MAGTKPAIMYNLFPRFYKTMDQWACTVPHIADMHFNCLYVNPFHETGFSGSLYGVKDYYRLNPWFLPPGADPADWGPLDKFIRICKAAGLQVIMDLVINHTAADSVLVGLHPEWYRRDEEGKIQCPYAIDPANADNITVWGDLAEIDYTTKERKKIVAYWDKLIAFCQKKGFDGFRCDAAYKIEASIWKTLIGSAKKRFPGTRFFAETLGCTLEQTMALDKTGFDYLFNSSKWWNFDADWCLKQHADQQKIAPSISFAESHDTERLASLPDATIEIQKSRYLFSAIYSEGLLMPQGYEYGAQKRIDVVSGTPDDLEPPRWDLRSWIRSVNDLKLANPVFCCEGSWELLSDVSFTEEVIWLKKSAGGRSKKSVVVAVNRKNDRTVTIDTSIIGRFAPEHKKFLRPIIDPVVQQDPYGPIELLPAEIVLFF